MTSGNEALRRRFFLLPLTVGREDGQDLNCLFTQNQVVEALGRMGLEEVPALGEKFDPDIHNAVMKSAEGEPGTVLEVFEKGYRVKGRMIRYAMVKIAVEE